MFEDRASLLWWNLGYPNVRVNHFLSSSGYWVTYRRPTNADVGWRIGFKVSVDRLSTGQPNVCLPYTLLSPSLSCADSNGVLSVKLVVTLSLTIFPWLRVWIYYLFCNKYVSYQCTLFYWLAFYGPTPSTTLQPYTVLVSTMLQLYLAHHSPVYHITSTPTHYNSDIRYITAISSTGIYHVTAISSTWQSSMPHYINTYTLQQWYPLHYSHI